jgi:hypothetical protein
VQPRQLLTETLGFGYALHEVIEGTQIGVAIGNILEVAPRDGLGAEVRRDSVDGRCRLIFPLESLKSVVAE